VDPVAAEADVSTAAAALSDGGFGIGRPPEDRLCKAIRGAVVVDALHRLNGVAVQQALQDCC
jgi:hypothetical protein